MKPYKKDRFKGFEPAVEITYNEKKKAFAFHISGTKYTQFQLLRYLTQVIYHLSFEDFGKNLYDTACPRDRKKLNKKK